MNYKAKQYYQRPDVAVNYDAERLRSWSGRIAHGMEMRILAYAIGKYCTAGAKVLDVPCGTGRLLPVYSAGGFQVTGGDVSEEMLKLARQRFAGNPLFSFEKCDAEKLPFDDCSFDYLFSFRLMAHLPAEVRRKVLGEMVRVTKGLIFVNYHFDVNTPVMMINRMLGRLSGILPYPLIEKELEAEVAGLAVSVVEVRKLSWFERSSALVIMRRK